VFRFNCIAIGKPATTSINSTDKRKIQFHIMSAFSEREREKDRNGEGETTADYLSMEDDFHGIQRSACNVTVAAEINLSPFNNGQTDPSTAARAASWPLTTAQVSQLSLPGRRRSRTHRCATLPSLSLPHCGCTALTAAERERERERERIAG